MLDQTNETFCYSSSSEPTPAPSQAPKSLAPCTKAARHFYTKTAQVAAPGSNMPVTCALAHLSTNFRNRHPKAENKYARAAKREGMRISAGAIAFASDKSCM